MRRSKSPLLEHFKNSQQVPMQLPSPSRKIRYMPVVIGLVYLTITVLLFCFGPIWYTLEDPFRLYGFLFAAYAALLLGYMFGVNSLGKKAIREHAACSLVKISISSAVLWKLLSIVITRGSIVSYLVRFLEDPIESYGVNYSNALYQAINYVEIFVYPLDIFAVTTGIFFYGQLTTRYRLGLIAIPCWYSIIAISFAIKGPIISVLLPMSVAILAYCCCPKCRLSRRIIRHLVLIGVTISVLFAAYFTFLVEHRSYGGEYTFDMFERARIREDMVLYSITPDRLKPVLSFVAFYLGHGYARLDQAMSLPFEGSGCGIANSPVLIRTFRRVTGSDVMSKISYAYRLDELSRGPPGNRWQTIFPWFASDLTFPGTFVVTFLIGFALGRSWADVIYKSNPYAFAVFAMFFYFVYKIPMNNPLGAPSGLLTYIAITLLWCLRRSKKLRVKKPTVSVQRVNRRSSARTRIHATVAR